jgi:hypothetical protein
MFIYIPIWLILSIYNDGKDDYYFITKKYRSGSAYLLHGAAFGGSPEKIGLLKKPSSFMSRCLYKITLWVEGRVG